MESNRTFEFSGNSSDKTGIEIGNLAVSDDVTLNFTGETDTGIGVEQIAGKHLTVSDNGRFNVVGTATGSGTGVKIGGSISTTGSGRVNIRGVSGTGAGVVLQGAITVSGGTLEITGSSTDGAGVHISKSGSLQTSGNSSTRIFGNSVNKEGVENQGTISKTENSTLVICSSSHLP
ncbi:MAG: hypothetical protein LBP94_04390 [Zoogloeaceae bacterium]|jgi:hypothetical protein|nr:hypothetical protein [Zoogloeaceae bacterium]